MRLSHDGGREEGTGKRVITMFKRLLCLMVSCVFISMVCIPAAHADDAQGSIDLNVQYSENSSVQSLNNAVFVDSRKLVGTVLLSKHYVPPEPVLTSFPITGKYTLPIVISLVLIAGITIIFIHKYGRKHNG